MPAPRVLLATVLALLLSACASLPQQVARIASTAATQTEGTRLGQALAPQLAAHPGLSGIHPLAEARDAFAARILLARAAERSLDLQYYIWRDDTTGRLLWRALWEAAERGVRVRLLLDDANTGGIDPVLAALDAHPNIEVRLFNPFANRGFRLADFAGDFSRVNRRMHNKSFTADNQATIVGGRNVGDEYYGADLNVGFQDLDVLAAGPVVREVSTEFDRYWNSEFAWPAQSLLGAQPVDAALLAENWRELLQDPQARRYVEALRQAPLVQQLADGRITLEWSTAKILSDDPDKVRAPSAAGADTQLVAQLAQVFGSAQRELDLVSPYFVPGEGGTAALAAIAARGVKVRVLTNSLAATDVAVVHAGYAKYRKALLASGVTLYELQPGAADVTSHGNAHRDEPGNEHGDEHKGPGLPGSGGSSGSSSASLHAKTFAVDRSRIFVGSFNLDPRSARINTEMGMLIDSPALAQRLSSHFDSVIPQHAYEVRLQPDGSGMVWIDRGAAGETRVTSEPGSGLLKRMWIRFLSVLPIESQL